MDESRQLLRTACATVVVDDMATQKPLHLAKPLLACNQTVGDDEVFCGIPGILVGDLYQLGPVTRVNDFVVRAVINEEQSAVAHDIENKWVKG